jgi:protease IV
MQDTQSPIPPPPGGGPQGIPTQGMAYPAPPRRSRWWIPFAVIGGILLGGLVVFAVVIFAFIGGIMAGLESSDTPKSIKDNTVLVIDMSGGLQESSTQDPFAFLSGGSKGGVALYDVLEAIGKAKSDEKIRGIYITGGASGAGMAKLAEVRAAIEDFKSSRKFVYAYVDMGTKSQYYMASVADSVFMPHEGLLEFTAFGASAPFMKGLYDKLGVSWNVEQFEEYKSAAESMTRDKWSEPAKEEVRALLEQRNDMFIKAVAESRRLEPSYVRAVMDHGVYVPDSLKHYRLVDALVHEEDVRRRIHARMNPNDTNEYTKLRTVSVSSYVDQSDEQDATTDKGIAIVYASGVINSGKQGSPFDGEGIYAKTFIKNLKKAAKDDDVKGIIIRIDSPGGSAFASDEMWTAIREVRKSKPVFASMSDVAASGGYYMAMACDTIIAHPATITGSIGVIMAMPNLTGTIAKVGVTVDTINLGPSASFMNPLLPLTDTERTRLHEYGANTYRRFVQKVADSRGKDFESTRLLARGRVWTGADAKQRGLVDIEGGLGVAISAMKKRLNVGKNEKIEIFRFPREADSFAALLAMLGQDDEASADEEPASGASARSIVEAIMARVSSDPTGARQVYQAMPRPIQQQVDHTVSITQLAMHEHALMVLPVSFPME